MNEMWLYRVNIESGTIC